LCWLCPTDARDAQAIWVAAQQPHIKAVPVKNEQQQACLTLHRMRAQLMKVRIMQTNALRGLLYEFVSPDIFVSH
jgi:transposase